MVVAPHGRRLPGMVALVPWPPSALAGWPGVGGGWREAGDRSGNTDEPITDGGTVDLSLSSPAFADGGPIPREYTCAGDDHSPALSISGVPGEAEALALVLDDPDAPSADPFVHWLLWNVPPGTDHIPEGVPTTERVDALDGAAQGTNGFGELGYRGPCPPTDDGAHTYRLRLFALDERLQVDPGADRSTLLAALDGSVVAETTLHGTFDRS